MGSIRKLPSGKWQATVRVGGKRITHSHALKRNVETWAAKQEVAKATGGYRDPRGAKTLLVDWHHLWTQGRVVAKITQRKNDSHWRVHVEPKWGGYQLGQITKLEVQAWVKSMDRAGVGAHTIEGAKNLLAAMLAAAVDEHLIPANPCKGVATPPTSAGRLRFFTEAEQSMILDYLDEPHRLFCDLSFHTGMRWGEVAGLHGEQIEWGKARLTVTNVLTRDGLRAYPKSKKSNRPVPIPERLVGPLMELGQSGPLFRGPDGGLFDDNLWRRRVWRPALERAHVPYAPPHTMRHTAASRLVQRGVPLLEVQRLLGHESHSTTQKYSHLAPDRDDAIRAAWD